MGGNLDDFVQARVEEEIASASQGVARHTATDGEDWVGDFTQALDKRELLGRAVAAEFDGRGEYAVAIRLRLAESYRSHPDYRPDWGV